MLPTGKAALWRTWAQGDRLKAMCRDKSGEAFITQGR